MKDLHAGTTPNTRKILDHVMDSIAVLANANFKLNMKRQELIKPDLNPPQPRSQGFSLFSHPEGRTGGKRPWHRLVTWCS